MTYAGNVNVRSVLVSDIFNQSINAGDYIFKDPNDDPVWYDIGDQNQMKQRLTDIGFLTLQVSFSSGGVLSMAIKSKETGDILTTDFMTGDDIRANSLYIFTIAVTESVLINFSYSLGTTIQYAVLTSHGGIY